MSNIIISRMYSAKNNAMILSWCLNQVWIYRYRNIHISVTVRAQGVEASNERCGAPRVGCGVPRKGCETIGERSE
jgi:hypothetical protein